MNSLRYSVITPMTFARDWTKYDYITETRLDVMKNKLSKAIDHLRNQIEYNQGIARVLQEELRVQVENFRKDYPVGDSSEEARDRQSVFVYNIRPGSIDGELKWHFEMCGSVKDVMQLRKDDKFNGVAYVEFEDEIYANIALCMTNSLFMGQRIHIVPRNMTIELNVMQAITTFWGQHLEIHFDRIKPLKDKLRNINVMSSHLQDLMETYVDVCHCGTVESSQKLMNLIRKSLFHIKFPMSSRGQLRTLSPAIDWTDLAYPTLRPLYILKTKLSKAIDLLERKLLHYRTLVQNMHIELTQQTQAFSENFPPDKPSERARDKRSVFVYNIKQDAVIGDLKMHFELCGQIEDIVMLFKDGEFLGKARVTFQHEVNAYIALCMNKSHLVGQQVRVLPWGLNFGLEIIQIIVKKWGEMLEDRFTLVYDVKQRLRVITAISNHRYELMALFLRATIYKKDASVDQIRDLIADSLASLELIGRYPISYLECDEILVGYSHT